MSRGKVILLGDIIMLFQSTIVLSQDKFILPRDMVFIPISKIFMLWNINLLFGGKISLPVGIKVLPCSKITF